MSRSQQSSQLATGNSMVADERANAATTGNAATQGYLAEQKNPGYTPAEQTAITGATEGGLGAAFGSAQEGAANTAARTNNAAGLTSQQDALARQRMITSGNLGAQNATNFANARIAGTNNANAGLGGLYGTNVSGANQTMGVNAKNAATPGFWDQFGNAFAGTWGAGLGGAASPGGMAGAFG